MPVFQNQIQRDFYKPDVVPGTDAAGEVVSVGPKAEGFEIGEQASSFKHGGYPADPNGGLVQEYVLVDKIEQLNYINIPAIVHIIKYSSDHAVSTELI
ncbi:unnamed protein product [Ambrosiozyma monospora]|uniref:Unnamed protein product n=1 Tax=Ambrosiozyma monospora TaxID=43982 RepID=A0ACB5TAX3_AMBMO|nr:unnamed protein product [Ambrosiozyma monospora]